MFLGEFNHVLDNKNRLRLPAKLKKSFGANVVLTKGTDKCLFVLPSEKFEEVFARANELSLFSSQAQKPLRMLFSSAVELEEDAQGRFLLPQNLKSYANIDKNVVFVGVGNRVELWSEEIWQTYSQNNNFDSTISELANYGI